MEKGKSQEFLYILNIREQYVHDMQIPCQPALVTQVYCVGSVASLLRLLLPPDPWGPRGHNRSEGTVQRVLA